MVALHIWAMAHGVAVAVRRPQRRGPLPQLPMTPEDLLESGLLIYLQSLGICRRS